MQETELYDRQKELGITLPFHVGVIGCGGIGTWVAIFAAMSGVQSIELSDPDVVDGTNLNRLPYTEADIGRKKTEVLGDMLRKLRPGIQVTTREKSTDFNFADFVFICTDNLDSKQKYAAFAAGKGKPFAVLGYDGNAVSMSINVVPEVWDNGPDGYRTVPSWVAPPALLAAWAVDLAFSMPGGKYVYDGDIAAVIQGRMP